jgi:hypothetical protein
VPIIQSFMLKSTIWDFDFREHFITGFNLLLIFILKYYKIL